MNGPPRYLTQIRTYWYYEREIPAKLRPHFLWEGKPVTRRLRIKTGEEDLGRATLKYAQIHPAVESALAVAAGQIRPVIHDQTDQEIAETLLLIIRKFGPSSKIGDDSHYIANAERELQADLAEPLKGKYRGMIATALMSSIAAPASNSPAVLVKTPPDSPTLKKVMERFLADPKAAKSLASGSKSAFDLFKQFVGEDTPFNQITRVDCRGYQQLLIEEEYKASTLNSYLNKIGHLFTWSIAEQIITSHPALNLKVKDDGSEKTGFTDEELEKLFPPDYMKKTYDEERFWLPLVMVLQGCRPNEAAQLHIHDIIINHDIPHIFFHKCIIENGLVTKKLHPMKTIKENASNRRVPIHPVLIKLGFLDFVKSRKNYDQLFNLNRASKPRHWDNNYQWFHDKFLGENRSEDKTMHGLRYTWKAASQSIRGESPKHISELAGWSTGNTAEEKTYRTFTDLDILLPVLSKISYKLRLFNRP